MLSSFELRMDDTSPDEQPWGWKNDVLRRRPSVPLHSRQVAQLEPIPRQIRGTYPLVTQKRIIESKIRDKWEAAQKQQAETSDKSTRQLAKKAKKTKSRVKRRSVIEKIEMTQRAFDSAIPITVESLDGRKTIVEVGECSQRIFDVKDEIEDAVYRLFAPTRQQRLIFEGKIVDEESTLAGSDMK